MEKKNYYAILGVSPFESKEGVRAAYRRLAKEYHPDVAGGEKTGYFQEITEAYMVLSKVESREAYDKTLSQRNTPFRSPGETPPAGGKGGRFAWFGEPIEDFPLPFRGSSFARSPFEGLWGDRNISGGLFVRSSPYSMEIEVLLTGEEARRGGVLPLELPMVQSCPLCRGGRDRRYGLCPQCAGQGAVQKETRVRVHVPAGIEDGTRLEVRIKSSNGQEEGVILRFFVQ